MKKRRSHRNGVKGVAAPPKPKPPVHTDPPAQRKRGGVPSRSESQMILDRAEMVNLLRRGWTQAAIAEKLGLRPSNVNKDWTAVLKDLLKQQTDDTKACVAIKLEEYGLIKREAWAAWEQSKRDSVNRSRKTFTTRRGDSEEETTEVKGGRGDPRYLKVVCECLAAERELKGLDAPKELNVNQTLTWDVLSGVLGDEPSERQVDAIEGEILRALNDRRGEMETLEGEVISSKDTEVRRG